MAVTFFKAHQMMVKEATGAHGARICLLRAIAAVAQHIAHGPARVPSFIHDRR